jgi:hypothetical protein
MKPLGLLLRRAASSHAKKSDPKKIIITAKSNTSIEEYDPRLFT